MHDKNISITTRFFAVSVVGLLAVASGCGGGKQAEKATPVVKAADAGASAGGSRIERLCKATCSKIADKCTAAADKPNIEECVFACIDETDGVLEDVSRCLKKADGCAAAKSCRAKFDGDKTEE